MIRIELIKENQATEVSELIYKNLKEINSRNYSSETIAFLMEAFSPENIIKNMKKHQTVVAMDDTKVVGTGGLSNFGSEEKPSYYGLAFFVDREYQRKGVGKQLVKDIENRAIQVGAEKITVRSAIGAQRFYEKLGYKYHNGEEEKDKNGNYIMEKEL